MLPLADTFTVQERSALMGRIRGRGNQTTELTFVRLLREHGIKGWRRHLPLPGRPDFTFRKEKVLVFVDGCFWHGCPRHGRAPTSNGDYWAKKLARNRARDRQTTRLLRARGWQVVRLWEHALKPAVAQRSIRRIQRILQKASESAVLQKRRTNH